MELFCCKNPFNDSGGGDEQEDARSFVFTISRQDEHMHWGIALDGLGRQAIHVCRVSGRPGTPVQKANRSAASGRRLQAGDYIVSVNGLAGRVLDMMDEVEESRQVELQVCRPLEFVVSVNKSQGPLGCRVTYNKSNGTSLLIEEVQEGCVQRWNSSNKDQAVQPDDRIISVNGKSGGAGQLLQMIKEADGHTILRISRPWDQQGPEPNPRELKPLQLGVLADRPPCAF
mmetsp:Transcript_107356/g.335817  ORF Transcript_107356/g.335817 Transcript_107356/m.335817 type:complete len:229 (-) Transcript_107356:44-730(-)